MTRPKRETTTLPDELSRACSALGLVADLGFALTLPGMRAITAVARIRDLGDRNGMLVVSDFEQVRAISDRLTEEGYGYSVMEPLSTNEEFDLDSLKEVFRDWGWSGAPKGEPEWMR